MRCQSGNHRTPWVWALAACTMALCLGPAAPRAEADPFPRIQFPARGLIRHPLAPRAEARFFPSRPPIIVFEQPNLIVFCSISRAFRHPVTRQMARDVSFTVFNDSFAVAGPNTTRLQVETGDPDSDVGTAIVIFPVPNPGIPPKNGWVYHMTVPDDPFIRVDIWADFFKNVSESNEGDNYTFCVHP